MGSPHLRPPRILSNILKRLLSYEIRSGAMVDFTEQYDWINRKRGRWVANIWYSIQILQLAFSVFSRSMSVNLIMLKNYFTIAVRHIKRYKGYACINTAGLAIGMACCILILLYIQFELSFDRYHEKADRIFLLKRHGTFGATELTSSSNNALSALLMKRDFSEVEDTVRIGFMPDPAVRYGDKKFYEDRVIYADDSFFDVFTYPMAEGDPESALKAPYSVVITEEVAEKYFGTENPVGRSLRFNDKDDFTVTGVIKSVPRHSHLLFDVVCSFQTLYSFYPKNHAFLNEFTSNNYRTYILLREKAEPVSLEAKFPDFIEKHAGPRIRAFGYSIEYFLMPLTDIHLRTPLDGGRSGIGAILYIYIFALVALFIMLIACINFMNLATARSTKRAQEIGIRKVLGAVKGKLVTQFLFESYFYSFFSLFLALVLAKSALPAMSFIAGYELTLDFSIIPWLFPALVGIVLLVGFIAGSYPAFFLSAFQPVRVLKGAVKAGGANVHLRNVFVVMQFSISVMLIIGTFIIVRQLNYMKNKNPGFQKEQVVVLPVRDEQLRKSLGTIKNELRGHSDIVSAAVSSDIPGQHPQHNSKLPEGFPRGQSQLMYDLNVDEDFISTMGMEIIAGRGFSKEYRADQKSSVIINETAAREFGWENPLGKKIGGYRGIKTVIGVVRDYHQLPLSEEIKPIYIRHDPGDVYNPFRMLSVRIVPGNMGRAIKFIEAKWNEVYPNHPFTYFFLDESFGEQFREMERIRTLIIYFAGLAILIACLGLFGLSSYIAEQRTKEIGIRKALGASASGIVCLISKELVKMILLANVIAWPAAFFVMRSWLSTFPYRANITIQTFLFSGVIVLLIGLATVSFQSIKAGLTDPVDSLRYE